MIPFDDALHIILDSAWVLPEETVPLERALYRVLAQDVHSDIDMPPFRKSTMDGFACRAADTGAPLFVVETIAAGQMPTQALSPGQCARIMTGAPIPDGADCVIIVEQTEEAGGGCIRFTGTEARGNISERGEDVHSGDLLLRSGTLLLPQHLAVLALAGCAHPRVTRQPHVAVFSTGDEIVPPHQIPADGQIRNSNSAQISALAQGLGCLVTELGIVPDDHTALTQAFATALATHDVVLSTGGVSMGDFDLVPDIAAEQGLVIRLRRVAIQPGKPIVFAVGERNACYGLSGNPVSSFLQFELLVKPLLLHLQGARLQPLPLHAPLAHRLTRKRVERMGWLPIAFEPDGRIVPIDFHGSAHLTALAHADGLIAFPVGLDTLEAGTSVPVHLLRSF